ncbi:MAG: hypothetical protein ACRDHZ_10695 [Ktedonobacteraceae bacterium]
MIDRFNDMLPHLERLPKETQDEIMSYIEVLLDALEHNTIAHDRVQQATAPTLPPNEAWTDPVGAWSDLPDTFLEELDQLRYMTPPTQ